MMMFAYYIGMFVFDSIKLLLFIKFVLNYSMKTVPVKKKIVLFFMLIGFSALSTNGMVIFIVLYLLFMLVLISFLFYVNILKSIITIFLTTIVINSIDFVFLSIIVSLFKLDIGYLNTANPYDLIARFCSLLFWIAVTMVIKDKVKERELKISLKNILLFTYLSIIVQIPLQLNAYSAIS